jgi:predicted protein tyrosine phosphatase
MPDYSPEAYSLASRIANASNPHQGSYKKVLCVCSAGILRSPTAAMVLTQPPFNFNTRAAGIESTFALILIDNILLEWADEIVCMTLDQQERLKRVTIKPIHCYEIEDNFNYRDPDLIQMIVEKSKEIFKSNVEK